MSHRRIRSLVTALLVALGCGRRLVPPERLAYPVVALAAAGPEVYADAAALGSATEITQDRYLGLEILDGQGNQYRVEEARSKGSSGSWFLDLSGNRRIAMELGLRPGPRLDGTAARDRVIAEAQARADHLYLLEGGREPALAALRAARTLPELFALLAGPYERRAVMADFQRRMDARDGIPPRPAPR